MSFSFSVGQRLIAWICLVVFVTTSVVVYPEPARAHISTNPSYSSSIRSGATPNDNLETSVQAGTTLDSCLSLSSKSGRDLAAWQNRISYLVANTKSEPKDEVIACMPMLMAALERDLYHAFEKDCASHEPIETSFIYIGPKIKNDYLICEPTMKSAFTLIESVQNLMSQYDPYLRNNSHVQEIHKRAIFPAEIAANDLFHNQALQIPYVARNEAFVVQHYNEVPFTKLIWSTFRWYSFLFTAQKTMYLHQTPLAEMFAWASHRNRSGADHTSSTVARMFEVIQGHKIPWRKDGLVDIERQNQFRERFDRPHTEASPEQLHQLLVDVTYTDVQARFSNLISQWVDQLDSYQESENAFIDHHGKTGSLFVPLSTRFKSWMCGDCNQTIQDELGIKHNLGKWMEEHALDTKIARTDSLPVKEDIICTREEKLLEEQKTYNEARAKLKSQCYDMNLTFRSGMTNSRNANKEQIEKDASGYGDDGSWRYEQGLISHDVRYTEWAKTNSRALLGQETLDTYQSLWSNLTQTNVGQLLTADETFGKTLGFSEYGQGLQDCIVEGKIVSLLHSIDPYVAAKRRNLDEQARDLRKSFALHHSLVHRQVEDEEEVLTALSNEHVPALIWYLMDHPSQIAAYTILRGVQNNAHKQSWRQLWRILPVFVASMVGDLLIFSLGSIPARMLYPMIISASFIDAVQTIEGAHFAKIEEKKLRKTLSRYQGDGMWLQQILSQATHDQQTVSSTWQRLAANAIFTGLAATAGIKGKQQVNADPTEGGMMPRVYEKFVLPSLKPITPAPVRIGGRSVIPGASNMGVPINPKGSNYFVDDVIGGAGIGKPITPQGNGGSGSVMTATPKTSTAQMLDTPRGSQLMENIRQPAPSPILNQIRQTQQQANVQVQQTLNPMLHYGTWVAPLVVPMTQNEAPLTIGDLLTNEQLEQIRKTQDASRKSEIETHSPLKQEAEKIIRGRDYSLISDEMILQIQKMTRDTGELGRLARAWLQRYKETHNIERDVINLLNGYQTKNIPFTILHLQEIERMAKDDSHLIERGLARDFLYMATLNQTYARLAKPREMSANAIQLKQNFDLLIAGLKQFFPNLGEKKLLEFANHIHENFYYTPNWTLTNGKFSGYTYLQLDPKFVLSEGRTYELNLIFVLNPNKETRIVVKRFLPDDAKIYSIGMLLKLMQDGQLVQRRALAGGDLALPNETYSYLTANSDLSRPAQPFVAEEYEEIPRTYSTPAPPEHFIPSNNPIPQPITTPLTNPVESPSIQDPQTNQILNSLFLFEKYGINVDRPAPFSMIESGPAYRPVPKKAPRLPDRHKKEPKTPPTKPAQKPTKNVAGQNSTEGNALLPPTTPINLIIPSSDSNFPIRPSANHWEEKLKIEIEPTTQKTMWQLLNEAMSGEFTIPHIMALRNAKEGCLKENADKEFCTQIISRLYSIDYEELKKFSVDPKEFIEWWETLKYVMVDGKIVANPFTSAEIAALYRQANIEFEHLILIDADARAAKPHMVQHMENVDSKRALIEALGINFEYYRLLVFLHDAGKYISSARVLLQALKKYEKPGQQKLFGKVAWHDQSTTDYLLDLGQRLNIDPAKMEHLIKDIVGHNDGSGLLDIFWNKVYPGYPLPLRLECYLLALFDRLGQGDWTGAAKILPQTVQTEFFDKVHDAYFTNPTNTIRQLEIIYQSILRLLQERGHSPEAQKLLKETFDEAVAMQQETMDGYSRLVWSKDHKTVSITFNGRTYEAKTIQEFLRPEFQEALISSGNGSGGNGGSSNTPPTPTRPSPTSNRVPTTDKPTVTIVMPRPNPHTSPVQTIYGVNDPSLTIILNQGLQFGNHIGDDVPVSQPEENTPPLATNLNRDLIAANMINGNTAYDPSFNKEICKASARGSSDLKRAAKKLIKEKNIECDPLLDFLKNKLGINKITRKDLKVITDADETEVDDIDIGAALIVIRANNIRSKSEFDAYIMAHDELQFRFSSEQLFNHPYIKALMLNEYETWAYVFNKHPLIALHEDIEFILKNSLNYDALNNYFGTRLKADDWDDVSIAIHTLSGFELYQELYKLIGTAHDWITPEQMKEIMAHGVMPIIPVNYFAISFYNVLKRISEDPAFYKKITDCLSGRSIETETCGAAKSLKSRLEEYLIRAKNKSEKFYIHQNHLVDQIMSLLITQSLDEPILIADTEKQAILGNHYVIETDRYIPVGYGSSKVIIFNENGFIEQGLSTNDGTREFTIQPKPPSNFLDSSPASNEVKAKVNQGLLFDLFKPVEPRLETDIYFGDPLPESNDDEREAMKKFREQNKGRLQKAEDALEKGMVDITYNREICIIAHSSNNILREKARRFISSRGIDCRVYQRYYYEISKSEGEFDFPDEKLNPLKAIEGIFAETEEQFNLTALAIDVAYGKKDGQDLRLLDEICRLYEEALTPAVHNRVFNYISKNSINCYARIVVPNSTSLSAYVRAAIAKNFNEFLETQPIQLRDEWNFLLRNIHSTTSNTPKASNVFYIMDEIFRLQDQRERESFFLKALKSHGENFYSPRDMEDLVQGQMLTQHLKTIPHDEAEIIRLHLISRGEMKGQDEDGRLRSIAFSSNPYDVRMNRQLKSIRIDGTGISVNTSVRADWDEIKQDVDGYIYIPGEDAFHNKYYFKFLNPKYVNVKDAQDFFNKQLDDNDLIELTSLIFDQAKRIQQSSPRLRSVQYIQDELWRIFYIAYDLKDLIVYHAYLREVGRDNVEIAKNKDGLKESLQNLHATELTINTIENVLDNLDFFINFEKVEDELSQAIRFFLEAPSDSDLQDTSAFASTMIFIAEGLADKLNDKQKFEFLNIIRRLREDDPQKLMYFFRVLTTDAFATSSANLINDFLNTDGERIQTNTMETDLNHVSYIYQRTMQSVNPETETSLVKQFTRLSKTKKHIKHSKDSIFSIQLDDPYPSLVTINLEEARMIQTVMWVPVRDILGRIVKFLEYDTGHNNTYAFIERSTLDFEADPTKGEDVVLNDYQYSRSPAPGKPEFNLGYMNQFRQKVAEGPNANHHTSMKSMMAHFMEGHQNERILFIPAREVLFGVPLEQFKIEYEAQRKPTVITQRIFEGHTSINHPALETYLTNGFGIKRIFVLRTKNTAAVHKGKEGIIQTLVPDFQQYRISLVLNPGGDENIELIFLEEKDFQ